MEYEVLDNGMPFEVIGFSKDGKNGRCQDEDSSVGEHAYLDMWSQSHDELVNELASLKSTSFAQHNQTDQRLSNSVPSSGLSTLSENQSKYQQPSQQHMQRPTQQSKQSGHFHCLVVGIGNYGCQNIDYISQKTSRCSYIKINADLKASNSDFMPIVIREEDIENGISESVKEDLHTQLEQSFSEADIVIVVSSLIDEVAEITPIICKQLNSAHKSNLVVLFKPTNHIQSEVDKANFILHSVQQEQSAEETTKNALVVLSEEKANARYEFVNQRWEGLFATVYDITECLDTFLNPKNSAQVSLSRMRRMLNCGGPTFYGRMTIKVKQHEEDGDISLDSLPEDLQEKSFVDAADLLYACNLIAIVKSSGEFSTYIESQLKTELGKIANANNDQSSSHDQVFNLSHLYDESIAEGEMEVILLATGIKGEVGNLKNKDTSPSEKTSVVNEENEQGSSAETKGINQPSPRVVAQPPSFSKHKVGKGLTPKESNITLIEPGLAKPPSITDGNDNEDIAILKAQHN